MTIKYLSVYLYHTLTEWWHQDLTYCPVNIFITPKREPFLDLQWISRILTAFCANNSLFPNIIIYTSHCNLSPLFFILCLSDAENRLHPSLFTTIILWTRCKLVMWLNMPAFQKVITKPVLASRKPRTSICFGGDDRREKAWILINRKLYIQKSTLHVPLERSKNWKLLI